MSNESEQIICTRNGVTILKPHWMSQEYWQKYMVNRCGKSYGKFVFGVSATSEAVEAYKAEQASAKGGGECDGCTI